MPTNRLSIPALLATAVLAATGCGEDKPTKAEYVADLDRVCQESKDKIEALPKPRKLGDIPEYTQKARPIVEKSIEDAEALELPEEDAEQFEDYVSGAKEQLPAIDELEQAAKSGKTAEVQKVVAKTEKESETRDAEAKKLGLKKCGSE